MAAFGWVGQWEGGRKRGGTEEKSFVLACQTGKWQTEWTWISLTCCNERWVSVLLIPVWMPRGWGPAWLSSSWCLKGYHRKQSCICWTYSRSYTIATIATKHWWCTWRLAGNGESALLVSSTSYSCFTLHSIPLLKMTTKVVFFLSRKTITIHACPLWSSLIQNNKGKAPVLVGVYFSWLAGRKHLHVYIHLGTPGLEKICLIFKKSFSDR